MKGCWFIIMTLMTTSAYADEAFDICHLGKQTVPSVTCYGPAVLTDTTINGEMNVAGTLRATNISVQSVIVSGSAAIVNSKVKGLVNVTGHFQAKKVDFSKDLVITSDGAEFDNSIVRGNITIKSPTLKPTLIVQCGTTIAGSVTFEGLAGVVQVTDDSMVQGKIDNGTLEFIDKECTH